MDRDRSIGGRKAAVIWGIMMAIACLWPPAGAIAAGGEAAATSAGASAAGGSGAMLPAPRSLQQSVQTDGGRLDYVVTVGAIPVRDDTGAVVGQVAYTAYRVPRSGDARPVTFALNGGPGSASVFLNFSSLGPRGVEFGQTGDAPSRSAPLRDNPDTWLTFTDLVFIDPIGTGYSRTSLPPDQAAPRFFSADADIQYLARVIYDWLQANDRMASPKYLVGESYGGYRVPRIARRLQGELGVGLRGLIMLSPYLDRPALGHDDLLSPLPWMIPLVGMAAAHLEREGVRPTPERMAPIEAYVRSDFMRDFLAGPEDAAATGRLVEHVAALTGLDPSLVAARAGRIDNETYLREIGRSGAMVASANEPMLKVHDPDPHSAEPTYVDPLYDLMMAPTTSAMADFVERQIGWRADGAYHAHNFDINDHWGWDNSDTAIQDLRKAMAVDDGMSVTIAHGWSDLVCGYFGSRLIIDQLPRFGQDPRIRLLLYPGGHMFSTRPGSRSAFSRDIAAIYAQDAARAAQPPAKGHGA